MTTSGDRGGEMLALELPWPDRALSPNARGHWAKKARAVRIAREAAWALTLEALKGRVPNLGDEPVGLNWKFHPKTANRVDDDNCLASCKAYRDGIADALGVNDANFISTYSIGEPVKGGAVLVTVRAA